MFRVYTSATVAQDQKVREKAKNREERRGGRRERRGVRLALLISRTAQNTVRVVRAAKKADVRLRR
jgi:hypothetical protein